MRNSGASNAQIQNALDNRRQHVGLTPDQIRNLPGIAHATGNLADVIGPWLFDGPAAIPSQVASRLNGKEFANFRAFREEFWRTVADTPELAGQFDDVNQARLRKGLAPFVQRDQRLGRQGTFQIHHPIEIQHGGSVFDMSNMQIVTPRQHNDIHNGGQ